MAHCETISSVALRRRWAPLRWRRNNPEKMLQNSRPEPACVVAAGWAGGIVELGRINCWENILSRFRSFRKNSQCRIKHTPFSKLASLKDKNNYLPLSHLTTAEGFLLVAVYALPSGANLGTETFEEHLSNTYLSEVGFGKSQHAIFQHTVCVLFDDPELSHDKHHHRGDRRFGICATK